jgi:sugar lactone lactonase YvrE
MLTEVTMRPTRKLLVVTVAMAAITALSAPTTAAATTHSPGHHLSPQLLVSGLQGSAGSTVGPDGALYVVEAVAGKVSRVDPRTGTISTFASGLPQRVIGLGGAMDIAFIHHTAYVLVTLVSPDVGGTSIDGIYRVDSPTHVTVVADIGAWSMAHPPVTAFFVPTGLQFALQPYGGGFLVTDGHHNRILRVTLDGTISERITFTDIVPTGLAVRSRTVFVALAGPVPHLPQDGKVVRFGPRSGDVTEVASGAPLLVDVEFGRGHALYALSQGHFTPGQDPGSPADPNTGTLERVNRDGAMTPIATGLDQPSSLEIIGNTAYVVTLSGEIWTIRLPKPRHRHH